MKITVFDFPRYFYDHFDLMKSGSVESTGIIVTAEKKDIRREKELEWKKREGNININTKCTCLFITLILKSSAHTLQCGLNVTLFFFWNDIFKVPELIFSILKCWLQNDWSDHPHAVVSL